MAHIVTQYTRPLRPTIGTDGIPHYVCADPDDPGWKPPPFHNLRIFHDGIEIFDVVEADRERGWARTLQWEQGRIKVDPSDGCQIFRLYTGVITFRLERLPLTRILQ